MRGMKLSVRHVPSLRDGDEAILLSFFARQHGLLRELSSARAFARPLLAMTAPAHSADPWLAMTVQDERHAPSLIAAKADQS